MYNDEFRQIELKLYKHMMNHEFEQIIQFNKVEVAYLHKLVATDLSKSNFKSSIKR